MRQRNPRQSEESEIAEEDSVGDEVNGVDGHVAEESDSAGEDEVEDVAIVEATVQEVQCHVCYRRFIASIAQEHIEHCYQESERRRKEWERIQQNGYGRCPNCWNWFPPDLVKSHADGCMEESARRREEMGK